MKKSQNKGHPEVALGKEENREEDDDEL